MTLAQIQSAIGACGEWLKQTPHKGERIIAWALMQKLCDRRAALRVQ